MQFIAIINMDQNIEIMPFRLDKILKKDGLI